jgi:glycosyltransferase involved in cell wall biosynthesis
MRTITISAINIFTSGPLTVVRDFLAAAKMAEAYKNGELTIILFCHSVDLYADLAGERVLLIEKRLSRRNWIFRLFYEYVWFWIWSLNKNVDTWVSMHDITPNVHSKHRVVYCHNPAPFYSGSSSWRVEPQFELFRRFYKYLYRINLAKNEFIVVQQQWLRDRFVNELGCNSSRVIVAKPISLLEFNPSELSTAASNSLTTLIFPAYPRSFKNFIVLLDAMQQITDVPVQLILTVKGDENEYSNKLVTRYRGLSNVKFVGFLSRQELWRLYETTDAMVFPSKLESWGLPLSEFRSFHKPIFVADLPYARETLSGYDQVCYFDPDDPIKLFHLLRSFVVDHSFQATRYDISYSPPFAKNWWELLQLIGLN